MQIQVIGSGCTTCKDLFELTKKAISELGMKNEVEYIPDVTKLIEMGVMSSPAIAIDGKPLMIGSTNSIEKIKDLISKSIANIDNNDESKNANQSKCTCGSKCC